MLFIFDKDKETRVLRVNMKKKHIVCYYFINMNSYVLMWVQTKCKLIQHTYSCSRNFIINIFVAYEYEDVLTYVSDGRDATLLSLNNSCISICD